MVDVVVIDKTTRVVVTTTNRVEVVKEVLPAPELIRESVQTHVVKESNATPSVVTEVRQTHVVTEPVTRVHQVRTVGVGPQGPKGDKGDPGDPAEIIDDIIDDDVVSLITTYSSEKILELLSPFAIGSFSVSPTTQELGQVLTSVTLNWSTNYTPTSLSLNQGVGSVPAASTGTILNALNITTNTTYTLTAVRNGSSKTANASIAFLNRVYWGVNASQTAAPATILSWDNQLSGSRSRSVTFDCSGGRYFHLAYPSRLGDATFKINNLTYSDMTKVVVSVTNAFGYTENYNVYYSNVIQYGSSITLVVQ